MKYIVTSQKTVEQAAADFVESVTRNKFGVLHSYDLKELLTEKGFPISNEVRIFDVCNPARASEVLAADMEMNLVLPCRVSVYEQNGKTRLGMIRPTSMLSMLSSAPELAEIAESVEESIKLMMNEAK